MGSSTFSRAEVLGSRLNPWKTKPIFWFLMWASSSLPSSARIDTFEEILPRRGDVETADDIHEGGLARPRRPHDGEELPLLDGDGDGIEREQLDLAQGIDLRDRLSPRSASLPDEPRHRGLACCGRAPSCGPGRGFDDHLLALPQIA